MKLPCLLGILSFALITQASGAGLSLSPSSASVDPNGGTYSFFVNESHSSFGGNDDWYWIREASWVSPQESINQDGDQTFTYIVAPNPSISSRSTRIRVVKDGGAFNSNVTRYHTITQAGLVPTLSLSSLFPHFLLPWRRGKLLGQFQHRLEVEWKAVLGDYQRIIRPKRQPALQLLGAIQHLDQFAQCHAQLHHHFRGQRSRPHPSHQPGRNPGYRAAGDHPHRPTDIDH